MRTVDRYLAGEFTRLLGWILLVFVCVYLVVDFSRIDSFLEHQAAVQDIVGYYVFKLPLIVFQTVPVAVLLSTMLLFATLTRHNEIVAFRACGVSLFRLVLPVLVCGVAVSGLTFLANEYVVPFTTRRMEYIEKVRIKKEKPRSIFKDGNLWFRGEGNVFYCIRYCEPEEGVLRGVTIFKLDEGFGLEFRVDADEMRWVKGGWRLYQATLRRLQDNDRVGRVERYAELALPQLREQPEDFREAQKDPFAMSYAELKAFISESERRGYDTARYRVDLYGKFSLPLISLVMIVLGIPFSLRLNRSGGRMVGFGLSVILGFVFWVVLAMGLAMGHGGRLPPWLAAWGPNLLFGGLGVYLLFRLER